MKDTTEAALIRIREEIQELFDGILGAGEYAFAMGIQTSDMYDTTDDDGAQGSQAAVMTNCHPEYSIELLGYAIRAVEYREEQEKAARIEAAGGDPLTELYTPHAVADFVNHLCAHSNDFEPESEESAIIRVAMASPIDSDGKAFITPEVNDLAVAYIKRHISEFTDAAQSIFDKIKNAWNN